MQYNEAYLVSKNVRLHSYTALEKMEVKFSITSFF